MPRLTRKKGRSKKSGGQIKTMTIPELRKAFEAVDAKIKANPKMNVAELQDIWKTIFGRPIDGAEAKSYLELIQPKMGGGKRTRKNRKQKGGVAPIDYTLRPGIDGTHGSYLPYVSSGLSFYDSINKIGMDADCGKIDTTPEISSGMGSNEVIKGGQRMFPAEVPPSIPQDFESSRLGIKLGTSSSVLDISNRVPRV